MADKKTVKSFLWGAAAGAITGAVTALLFAPKPGSELRKDIAGTANKIGVQTVDISRQAGTAVKSMAKKTTHIASHTKQATERFIADIRTRPLNGAAQKDADEETPVSD